MMDQGLWAPRMGAALLTLFGGLALLLAAIGVYGVLSYSVNQQTREIGIRMAMGAERAHVLRFVVGQGLRLAGVGVLLGVILAVAGMRQLFGLLFWGRADDPITFWGVGGLLVLVGLLARYVPA